jgi:acetyltransferase
MTGSDDVLNAAFRRCGVLRVTLISELFNMAEVLAKQSRPKGPRLTMITNAGGPGVLATDYLIATGGQLAELSKETITALDRVLPPYWSHGNPIDILGDAGPERYTQALEIAAQDPNTDGLLVILTPQAMTDPTQTAEQLKAQVEKTSQAMTHPKPILASWMGGAEVMAGESILNRAGIPTYPYPDSAARVFSYMWQYSYNLHGIYETPMLTDWDGKPDRDLAEQIITQAHQAGRTLLTEVESKQVLAAYGIPTLDTQTATSVEEAVQHAEAIGYPVVLKLLSETITHKTDVGGVQLNLADSNAVHRAYQSIESSVREKVGTQHFQGVTVQRMVDRDGYELILGSTVDPQFGPVLLFGLGGQLVEVFKDRALALPPLNTTLARRMMEQTRIYTALQGVRGREPVDLVALEQILVRFSQLVAEQRWIKEIDINPLLASPMQQEEKSGLIALDARIVLHEPTLLESDLPKLSIRPYPMQYVAAWTMKDGTEVKIRPIRPEDEPLLVQFHKTLSEESVYFRYFHLIKLSQRVAHERLTRICFIDYDREMALVAERNDPQTGKPEILAVGRLSKVHGTQEAEFALLVSDQYQGLGLGTELLQRLLNVGRNEQIQRINAAILFDNHAMQHICEKLGFQLHHSIADSLVTAEIQL